MFVCVFACVGEGDRETKRDREREERLIEGLVIYANNYCTGRQMAEETPTSRQRYREGEKVPSF